MAKRQKVLVLYLKLPSLEGEVISWATFDGTGKKLHMTGDSDEPPYPCLLYTSPSPRDQEASRMPSSA